MRCRTLTQDSIQVEHFSKQKHALITVRDFLSHASEAIETACLQNFAEITPQYPGIRAPLDSKIARDWAATLSPILSSTFATADGAWSMTGWFSLVTKRPEELLPIQRFPHVDGTDPNQIAMMLYLHRTEHGGTGFFRHRSTGLESLTAATFPEYKARLEADVASTGLPPRAYVTDGDPHFTRIHVATGAFNQAAFYRGNLFHSGMINNDAPLSADPRQGRLTINGFLRPPNSS